MSLVRSRLFLRTVPTALERSGDFSRTVVNVNGSPRALTLYDPFTVTPTGNNVWTRGLIPNGQIPATRLNAAAVKLFANYPLPNRTPDDLFNANNFPRSGTRQYDRNNLNSRFDRTKLPCPSQLCKVLLRSMATKSWGRRGKAPEESTTAKNA